jgi:predicted RNase H-like nuclease
LDVIPSGNEQRTMTSPGNPNERAVRFLGLDLAWLPKNPSGLAVLGADGSLLDLQCDLTDDAAVLAWIRRWLGSSGAIGIDMPTIVPNLTGSRPCERAVHAAYGRFAAGPYPANRGLVPFAGGGRAAALLGELAADGVVHTCEVAPRDPRTVAFEAFPHPSAVALFALPRILGYKKKARPWPEVWAAWAEYRRLLGQLADADPPLHLPASVPRSVADLPKRSYKRWDDALDAILCAYVASWVWHHGTRAPHVRVFGDMVEGHIVVPDLAAFPPLA